MDCHSYYYITKLEKKKKKAYLYLEDNENEKSSCERGASIVISASLDKPLGIKDAQNTCLLVTRLLPFTTRNPHINQCVDFLTS
jgi:hypothetical protein